MKLIIKFLIYGYFISVSQKCVSQSLYTNNNGEKVYISSSDTCFFKIANNDAFGSFSIGIGKMKHFKSSYFIKKNYLVGDQTSSMYETKTNDTTIYLKLLYHDSTPISYVFITIMLKASKKVLYRGMSNDSGIVILNYTFDNKQDEQKYLLQIHTVGFFTQKQFVFRQGNKYTIISNVNYDFTLKPSKVKVKINFFENDSINTYYNNNKSTLKSKSIQKANYNFQDFLKD